MKQIASLLESSKAVDIDLSLFPLQQRVGFAGSEPSSIRTIWWNQICRHVDHTAEDLERMSNYANLSEYAHLLLDVSPHSPQAIGLLVLHDHDFVRDKMKDWETDRPNQAVVMKALGLRYNQLGQFSDAERCLRRTSSCRPTNGDSRNWPMRIASRSRPTSGKRRSRSRSSTRTSRLLSCQHAGQAGPPLHGAKEFR